jgi:hypothetical protein
MMGIVANGVIENEEEHRWKDCCRLQRRIFIAQFLLQPNTNLHALYKPSSFMFPTESTDRIDHTVHVWDWYILHVAVEFSEAVFDLIRVHLVMLAVAIPEHLQDRPCITVTVVGWIGFDVGFQNVKI